MGDAASILPLKVASLSFRADGKHLLDMVSFTIPAGGVTAIIGPNGAGKSLTLRLCHGLLKPSAGQVIWGAQDGVINGHKRHAMVFQRPVMLRRSVRANIVHALAAMRFSNTASRAQAVLERFGLMHLGDRPARLLSGGEQQRLAMARAWSLEPEVLLLDEPTAHLDPGATRQIEGIITSLAAEGMTILMTTHDLGQARRLSRQVLFLDKGRLIESGATDSFFSSPSSAEARAFLNSELLW